jgi:hypothetical protein
MSKHPESANFRLAVNSLKEQGKMSNDTYIAMCKALKVLDHGFAVKNSKEIARAVEKLSKLLYEATR